MPKNQKAQKRKGKLKKHTRPSNSPPRERKPARTRVPELSLDEAYRTSVETLLEYKGLSKSWKALIDHPAFIQKHLNFNSSTNEKLICNCSRDNGRRKLIAFLRVEGPPIPVLDINIHFTDRPNYPSKINFPDFSKKMILAGSINGIVCLYHTDEMVGRFVALWNPAISCWKPIPLPETRSWKHMSVGLGFDVVTNDFKIICILPVDCTEDFGLSRVEIYIVNQDSWDEVDDQRIIPFYPVLYPLHCKFIVKGVPYWVGIDRQANNLEVLGGIDPCTGLFKKVLLPEHIKDQGTFTHFVNLKNSVAALVQYPGEYPNQMVDLYVLDENTSIWTRMYTIGPLAYGTLRIPQCLITGEIVLETWTGGIFASNMVPYFCDPQTSRLIRNDKIQELYPHWRESYSHVESFVRIKGMVQIGKEHMKKKIDPEMENWSEYLPEDFEAALHL